MFLTAFKPQCKGGVVFWGCRDRHSSTNRAASAGDVCCLRVLEDKSPTPRAERGWPPGAVRGSPARVSRRSRGLPTIWGRPWLVRASPRSLSLYVVFSLDTFMSKSPFVRMSAILNQGPPHSGVTSSQPTAFAQTLFLNKVTFRAAVGSDSRL